ncbi:MAG: hypothetical protein P4L83_15005 [Nevskia sp.]|nr:hypothetical protein [Nevskia sp.]
MPKFKPPMAALCLFLLAGAAVGTDTPAAAAPRQDAADRQLTDLQQRLRELIGQLDEMAELHDAAGRRSLMHRHWHALQDYMREVQKTLPPQPAGSEQMHLAFGSAAGCGLAADMDADRYVSQTRDLLWSMREQLAAVRQAGSAAERQRRLQAHAVDAYHGMQAIRGLGWMYGKTAPSGENQGPVPDAASTGAYLVHQYCGQCHAPPPAVLHSAAEWSGAAARMQGHMNLANAQNPHEVQVPSQREMTAIQTYLEANACETVD